MPDGGFLVLPRDAILALVEDGKNTARSRFRPAPDFTTRDLASRYSRSSSTIREWIRGGMLKAYRVGSEYRVTPQDLARFEDEKRQTSSPLVMSTA